ncbi:MAG: nucleotidyl transferase AbiEii/AbiGii toxin family protein [Caldiserica bacterium]|nr:nucleotidyl transferase AbiEii/AbiGii toxin family protein [Caldisericota bacterium]
MRSYAELVMYSTENALPLDQVIREELQRLILRHLSERGFFLQGVFQGGTSIRLVYGGTRFSEDLDFVLRPGKTIADLDLPAVLDGLPSFMRREVPFAERSSVEEQKAESTFARYRCRIELQAPIGGLVINLEFAGVPSRSPSPHILRSDTVDVAIVVEDEFEILVDKLVALALRSYVKGRDIWDTWFLIHEHHVAMPQVSAIVTKAADYGTTLVELTSSVRQSKTIIEASGLAALDAEMKRFLPIRLYDAMAPAFVDISTSVATMMDALLNQLTGAS